MPSTDADLNVKAAAFLYSMGRTQKEMAAELGVSQPTVSRLILDAKHQKFLTTELKLSDEDRRRVEAILYPEYELLKDRIRLVAEAAYVPPPATIRVFSAGRLPPDGVATPLNRETFASFVATHIIAQMKQMRLVGITWGKTLASVVHAVVEEHRGELPGLKIAFFPLCGESVDFSVNEYSASTHAARLSKFVGEEGNASSLGSTPARIPAKYASLEPHGVREFIQESKAYRRIFLDADASVNDLDAILATAGAIYKDATDHFMADLISREGISADELGKWTIGDVAGVFLPRRDLLREHAERIESINARWTGVSLKQIRQCADRARKRPDCLGVVLPVIGHSKAEITIEAIRLGLVNHLIVDHDLADAIAGTRRPAATNPV